MNLVILDAHTLNPGDLSWSALEKLATCTIHAHTPADLTHERSRHAELLLTNKTVLSAGTIADLPRLKYIGVLATGYNVVDLDAARRRGVVVTNVPGYGAASVAQATFAMILELTNHVAHHAGTVRAGRWCTSRDFCYWDQPLIELEGLTLGLVGLGQIARRVATIGQAFGLRIVAHTRTPVQVPGVEMVDLDTLFSRSDILSLHCPLTPDTKHLVNAARLAKMKSTALLINTGRGPLIDEAALAAALNANHIAGAALDVLAQEPPAPDNPLLSARNCLITPHIAWATRAARARLLDIAVNNVAAFLAGKPTNIVT